MVSFRDRDGMGEPAASVAARYIVRPGANRKGKTIFENEFCGGRVCERVKVTSSLTRL